MANFRIVDSGENWLEVLISNLQYSANLYDKFYVKLYDEDNEYISTSLWTEDSGYDSTSVRIDDLTEGTEYKLKGYATWDGVNYYIDDDTESTEPDEVSNLHVDEVGKSWVDLDWSPPDGNSDHYKIYYEKDGEATSYAGSTTSSSCTVTGLDSGTLYNFEVYNVANGKQSSARDVDATTDDHGNDSGSATVISLDSLRSGSILTSDDVDYFRFTTDIAGIYKIYTTGSLDTKGALEDSSGTEWATDDDTGEDFNFSIEKFLFENTTYYIKVEGFGDEVGSYTLHIDAPHIPDIPTEPVLYNNDENNRYEGGFKVDWSQEEYAEGYQLKVQYDNDIIYYSTTSSYKDIPSDTLRYGATYSLSVKSTSSSGDSLFSAANFLTTRPIQPTLTVTSTTNSLITVKVSGLADKWTRAYVNLYDSNGGLMDGAKYVTGNNQSVTFAVSSDTTYQIDGRTWLDLYNDGSKWLQSFYTSRLTVKTSARPQNFSWQNTSFSRGSDAIIDHDDWNDLLHKVDEFRAYKGLGTIFSSSDYVEPDDNLTAAIFNAVRDAINDMSPPVSTPSKVNPGEGVLASYFDGGNSLVEALNSIP